MSLFLQHLLDVHEELIVDLFAGGGGASAGIEQATGRMVDIAINHDREAVALHQANHPQTLHLVSDVFEVDPREVTRGRPVGFLWASPDCTYHSKARGGKPIRHANSKRRALAWVVTRWAGTVRPRVIMLENVEEFADWGPLVGPPDALRPCKRRRGRSFRRWVKSLEEHGYEVEWRELRACDYGAPTIRKRLYLIARCDGRPIVWPEPTHGPGRAKPYRAAAECIDWSEPLLSIFATREEAKAWGKELGRPSPIRPLAEKTMRRIARGVKRFVLDNPKPFLVTLNHGGDWQRPWDISEPMRTVTSARDAHGLVSPLLVPRYGERKGQAPRSRSIEEPSPVVVPSGNGAGLVAASLSSYHSEKGPDDVRGCEVDDPIHTIDTQNRHALVAGFLAQHNGGFYDSRNGAGRPLDEPNGAVCADGSFQSLCAATLIEQHGTADAAEIDRPLQTISAGGRHHGLVAAHLATNTTGHSGGAADAPAPTIATGGHHAVIAAHFVTNNNSRSPSYGADQPCHTVVSDGARHNLVAAHIQRDFGQSVGSHAGDPIGTVTGGGQGKAALVASFLAKYHGTATGAPVDEPVHTVSTCDRFGLVTVDIDEQTFVVDDIAMRMLQPRELYLAQGFRPGYIIDRGADGKPLTKTAQVRMVGNSVSPPVAEALVRANAQSLIVRDYRRTG
ncbi:MAG: DNA cytosine methyltransferase [Fimbriimonadaceae bacterium]|nr:DNA cytosine methyltransferase [Fimbriimonadaceae bacterium]QYK56624.1 MAG: DNA cytosine methyltransferase [Fimbriimonadaceae bacterium]